ncbi:tetratricopeptide repeat protein [Nitzschia inconspicua]|uniref:Tetratricopeptide repeat protein n=1 Tax=Nitzschia inconspicua TaxID=303405 RepID=A0A9K3PCH3_9STRA|nr:tetratricopeptide repeat protein [Nitzschia inconspicua]
MADRQKKLEAADKHFNVGKSLSWDKDDFESAKIELRKALQIRESIYGMFHIDTSKCYYEIGRAYYAEKKYNESLVMYRKALRIRVALFGKFHTETKNVDHCLRLTVQAKGLYNAKDINEAMDAIYDVLNFEIKGDTFRKAGRNAEAQVEYLKAAAVEEFHFGRDGEILGELSRKAGIKAPPPPGGR